MTRHELYQTISRKIDGCTIADVRTVLDVYAEVIIETLANDGANEVIFPDLGKFIAKERPERIWQARLHDGEKKTYTSPKHSVLAFVPRPSVKNISK